MKNLKKLIFCLTMFFLFILNVNATSNITFKDEQDGVIYLDLDDNKTKELVLNDDNYKIIGASGNEIINVAEEDGKYIMTAKNFGVSLISISIISKDDSSSILNERVLINVDIDNYLETVINNYPNEIVSNSNNRYETIMKYVPNNLGASFKDCKNNNNLEQCTVIISYNYCKEIDQNGMCENVEITKSKTVNFINNITLPIFYCSYLEVGEKYNIYLSVPNSIDANNLMFVSTNNTIATVTNTGEVTAKSPGSVEIRLYDKTTMEYSSTTIDVKKPTYNSIDDFINYYDSLEVEIDATTHYYTSYVELARSYFYKIKEEISNKFYINIIDSPQCEDNVCKINFRYYNNGSVIEKSASITLTISYKGIYANDTMNIGVNNEYYNSFYFYTYLDEDDTYSVIVDSEYLDYKIETHCYDKDNFWVSCDNSSKDDSKTQTLHQVKAKKTGETTIQIISSKGYVKEIKVYITHTNEEMLQAQNYFNSLNIIKLPYKKSDFNDNLSLLEKIIETKIKNEFLDNSMYQYLNLKVNCVYNDKCSIYSYLSKDISTNLTKNELYISNLINKIVFIEYDNLASENYLENLVKEIDKIGNRSLTIDDTLYLENKYNETEFYNNLINMTDIKDIISNSSFDISYSLLESKPLNESIKGSSTYRIYFKYDDKVIYEKDITIYSNHFITMPVSLKNETIEEKETYVKEYVGKLLNNTVTVEYIYENTYKVTNESKTFNVILDKKSLTQITGINLENKYVILDVNNTYKIKYSKYPSFANHGEITFTSSDTSVATVDENGVVTALKDGYAIIEIKVNYSLSKMLILVNKNINEFLNEQLDKLNTNITILYSDIYDNNLESAISLNLNTNNKYMGLLNTNVTKENDKYYAYLNMYTENGNYINSNKKEIDYVLKGISVNNSNIEMETGQKYDMELFFTEGDTNNLIIESSNKNVISVSKDGIITALKPGYSYIDITDKYNKYSNYITVVVDKEKYYYDSIEETQKKTIEIKASEYYDYQKYDDINVIISGIFNNKMQEFIPFYTLDKYIDSECNIETNKCILKIRNSYNDYDNFESFEFNIKVVGAFLDDDVKEIDVNEIYDPIYKKYPVNSTLKITSMDTSVCVVEDNKIKGISSGVCPVKYRVDGIYTYQIVVVDKSTIASNIISKFNDIDNNLTLNLEPYASTGEEYYNWTTEFAEYQSMYIVQLFNEVENRLNLPYEVYFDTRCLDDLNQNPYELDLNLNVYYEFNENDKYIGVSLLDSSIRKFNIKYEDFSTEDRAIGEQVKNNISDTYKLDLIQTLRFQMDGAKVEDLYKYSSLEDDILEICPSCTFILDKYNSGACGDVGFIMFSSIIVIMKNGIPISSKNSTFEVRFSIEMDVINSIDDITNTIKDKVKEAYLEIVGISPFSMMPFRRGYSRIQMTEPEVEVTRMINESTNDIYYNIKVEDIEFNAIVDIKTTNNIEYTIDVKEINVNKELINLTLGENEDIIYEVLPSNSTNKNVNIVSSNPEVAVYENGKIVSKGIGSTEITITAHNNVKKVINVTVTLPVVKDDENKVTKGDVNLDGKVNMTDLIKLRKQQAGLEDLSEEAMINADVNNDGRVNMVDIIKLRKYFAGLEELK